MVRRRHWAGPGFSALVLLALAACGGGGGGGGGGVGGSPSNGSSAPSVDFAVPNLYAVDKTSRGPERLGTLHVFGDSYSDPGPSNLENGVVWSNELVAKADNASLNSFARDSASAVSGGVAWSRGNDFQGQVDRWQQGSTYGRNDLTIVYLGYNDVLDGGVDLAGSIRDYGSQVDRLIGNGATGGDRRLFLTLVHDLGGAPDISGTFRRDRTTTLNDGIAAVSRTRGDKVIAVDLFTVVDRITSEPGRYGFDDIKTALNTTTGRDSSRFLYLDNIHFTARGQRIIAEVYNHYLTRAWDLANGLQGSAQNRQNLDNQLDQTLARLALVEGGTGGFTSFFVGNDRAAAMAALDVETGDPSRSGFTQLTRAGRPDAGVGLDYSLAADTRMGLVVSRYGSDRRYGLGSSATRLDTESDAVSVYVDTKLGGVELRTRASYAADSHRKATFNELVGETHTARHGGRTLAVSQTASTALEVGRARLQPWVTVTHSEQAIDGYTISHPFLSDLTYSGGKVSDTTASIGLQATSDAFALGAGTTLTLTGGLAYTRSLRAEDYEVTIREAALAGLAQTERVERDGAELFALRLGSVVAMGRSVAFSTDYAFTKQSGLEPDHAVTARFSYRF